MPDRLPPKLWQSFILPRPTCSLLEIGDGTKQASRRLSVYYCLYGSTGLALDEQPSQAGVVHACYLCIPLFTSADSSQHIAGPDLAELQVLFTSCHTAKSAKNRTAGPTGRIIYSAYTCECAMALSEMQLSATTLRETESKADERRLRRASGQCGTALHS